MDFKLTEEQTHLVDMVDSLSEKEFRPLARRWDENEEFPWENVKKLADLGLLGLSIPEEYGGGGRGVLDTVLVVEHIAQHCFNTAGILTLHCGTCSRAIVHFGSEELKKRFLPAMARGEKLAAYAQTEPNAGSDVGNLKTRAILDGDHCIINGSKILSRPGFPFGKECILWGHWENIRILPCTFIPPCVCTAMTLLVC